MCMRLSPFLGVEAQVLCLSIYISFQNDTRDPALFSTVHPVPRMAPEQMNWHLGPMSRHSVLEHNDVMNKETEKNKFSVILEL